MIILSALALTALSGCDAAQGTLDDIARDQARDVVGEVAADTFPGVNTAPYTDCVINSATSQEIFTIARASLTGVDAQTVSLVGDIARRPASLSCLAQTTLATL
ncbi:MAG: succinate dehydrogenase [Pseudomonadota bacterium]